MATEAAIKSVRMTQPRATEEPAQILGWSDYLSSNMTRLRNEATALRNRHESRRDQLTELASANFESWAKESLEIAAKFAYRNGGRIGTSKSGAMYCAMVAAAPVLPVGYVVSASRIADRRMMLAGYCLADLLTQLLGL